MSVHPIPSAHQMQRHRLKEIRATADAAGKLDRAATALDKLILIARDNGEHVYADDGRVLLAASMREYGGWLESRAIHLALDKP